MIHAMHYLWETDKFEIARNDRGRDEFDTFAFAFIYPREENYTVGIYGQSPYEINITENSIRAERGMEERKYY